MAASVPDWLDPLPDIMVGIFTYQWSDHFMVKPW
jgi:hypothetical protein